jgi:hypothetical protein
MSSATSIDRVLPPEDGSHKGHGLPAEEKPGFGIWHFFILLSLMSATVAVLITRQNTPENLILISLTILAAGIAAGCLYRVIAPLAPTAERTATPLGERLRADLEREKALALRSIKELEFDRAMGKLSAADFDEMAGRLRTRALGLMKQLEQGRDEYTAAIERELQTRLQGRVIASAPGGRSCTCGTSNDADARFCKACGTKLGAA